MGTCILWHLFKSEIFFAFNKEFLHNAVAIENFGLFIDTNLAPEKFFRGKITQGEWHNFRRPCALFLWVEFHVLPCILVCFLVEFDLCFAFGIVSCQILDSASLFILYVHEHGRLGSVMLNMWKQLYLIAFVDLVPVATDKVLSGQTLFGIWKSALRAYRNGTQLQMFSVLLPCLFYMFTNTVA